jgi:hypothetical protein
MRVQTIRVLMAVVLLSSFACVTPAAQKRQTFTRIARTFNDDLRWARYESAASQMQPQEAMLFLRRVDLVEDELVVGDIEVTNVVFDDEKEQATSTAKLQWYTKRDPIVRQTVLTQLWDSSAGGWLLLEQRRLRGERFPLVTEKQGDEEETNEGAGPLGPGSTGDGDD